tara:strand:- start:237 stop:596 length:360 start_codon:yes stop_codon:yes gene_type:complete
MGYRSEVTLVLHNKILPKFLDLLCSNEDAKELVLVHRDEYRTFDLDDEGKDHLLIQWNWLKWYTGYGSVDAIEGFIKEQDEEHYRLVRAGENGGDIDEYGEFCSDVVYAFTTNHMEVQI